MELEELGKRIEVLKDIEEIKNLHRDYIYSHNSENWNKMIDCFTETAMVEIVNSSARGKQEIASLFLDNIAKNEKAKGAHILIQPVITVEGDTARGHWIMDHFYYDVPGVQKVTWGQGRYYCEYIKKNGEWKFSLLRYTRPWPNSEIKL